MKNTTDPLTAMVARTEIYLTDLESLSRTIVARFTRGNDQTTFTRAEWARFDGALYGLRAVLRRRDLPPAA
jgi:hypothetical protein